MGEFYFLLSCSEDGDVRVESMSKATLLKRLDEKYYGENPKFVDRIPNNDMMYWQGKMVLIKGKIVVPQTRQVVETYDVE